jgi:hypothetical protein
MPLPRDVSTNPLVLAKTLKHLASFASMPHTTFEEQNARHLEPDATAARHHHADDAFSSMVRKLLRSNDSSSVRASNEAYLRFAPCPVSLPRHPKRRRRGEGEGARGTRGALL